MKSKPMQWHQIKQNKIIENMTSAERLELKLIINKIDKNEENKKHKELQKKILSMCDSHIALDHALEQLGKSVLYAMEPIIKPIVDKLNKILGGKK